ncbi:MAG: hypothetical protein EXS59_02635, partial [Candidatus Taylorbacteria bacterium]|nr:hypothetical protein [Candidatus Taylorbacteria bacterium]
MDPLLSVPATIPHSQELPTILTDIRLQTELSEPSSDLQALPQIPLHDKIHCFLRQPAPTIVHSDPDLLLDPPMKHSSKSTRSLKAAPRPRSGRIGHDRNYISSTLLEPPSSDCEHEELLNSLPYSIPLIITLVCVSIFCVSPCMNTAICIMSFLVSLYNLESIVKIDEIVKLFIGYPLKMLYTIIVQCLPSVKSYFRMIVPLFKFRKKKKYLRRKFNKSPNLITQYASSLILYVLNLPSTLMSRNFIVHISKFINDFIVYFILHINSNNLFDELNYSLQGWLTRLHIHLEHFSGDKRIVSAHNGSQNLHHLISNTIIPPAKKWYTVFNKSNLPYIHAHVRYTKIEFLLDHGCSYNLIPEAFVQDVENRDGTRFQYFSEIPNLMAHNGSALNLSKLGVIIPVNFTCEDGTQTCQNLPFLQELDSTSTPIIGFSSIRTLQIHFNENYSKVQVQCETYLNNLPSLNQDNVFSSFVSDIDIYDDTIYLQNVLLHNMILAEPAVFVPHKPLHSAGCKFFHSHNISCYKAQPSDDNWKRCSSPNTHLSEYIQDFVINNISSITVNPDNTFQVAIPAPGGWNAPLRGSMDLSGDLPFTNLLQLSLASPAQLYYYKSKPIKNKKCKNEKRHESPTKQPASCDARNKHYSSLYKHAPSSQNLSSTKKADTCVAPKADNYVAPSSQNLSSTKKADTCVAPKADNYVAPSSQNFSNTKKADNFVANISCKPPTSKRQNNIAPNLPSTSQVTTDTTQKNKEIYKKDIIANLCEILRKQAGITTISNEISILQCENLLAEAELVQNIIENQEYSPLMQCQSTPIGNGVDFPIFNVNIFREPIKEDISQQTVIKAEHNAFADYQPDVSCYQPTELIPKLLHALETNHIEKSTILPINPTVNLVNFSPDPTYILFINSEGKCLICCPNCNCTDIVPTLKLQKLLDGNPSRCTLYRKKFLLIIVDSKLNILHNNVFLHTIFVQLLNIIIPKRLSSFKFSAKHSEKEKGMNLQKVNKNLLSPLGDEIRYKFSIFLLDSNVENNVNFDIQTELPIIHHSQTAAPPTLYKGSGLYNDDLALSILLEPEGIQFEISDQQDFLTDFNQMMTHSCKSMENFLTESFQTYTEVYAKGPSDLGKMFRQQYKLDLKILNNDEQLLPKHRPFPSSMYCRRSCDIILQQWLRAGIIEPSSNNLFASRLLVVKKHLSPADRASISAKLENNHNIKIDPSNPNSLFAINPDLLSATDITKMWRVCLDSRDLNSICLPVIQITQSNDQIIMDLQTSLHPESSHSHIVSHTRESLRPEQPFSTPKEAPPPDTLLEEKIHSYINSLTDDDNKLFISSIDLKSAHQIIECTSQTSYYLNIITPNLNLFKFRRACFGLTSINSVFNQNICNILASLISKNLVIIYADDLLLITRGRRNHCLLILEVLKRFQEEGIKINLSKSAFFCKKFSYLGHEFSEFGIKLSDERVQALLQFPEPKSVKGMQRLLGCLAYINRFLPYLSLTTAPLSDLISKNKPFVWGHQQQVAFDAIKNQLKSNLVLHYIRDDAILHLYTDASRIGSGAVVFTKDPGTSEFFPIMFFSRKYTESQQKSYTALESE